MIRRADTSDILVITKMAKRFAASVSTGFPFSAAYAEARARAAIADPSNVVLLWEEEKPVGVLAGLVHQHMLFPVLMASEIMWWIEPSHRGRAWRPMLKAFEQWAFERDAERVQMACLDDRVGQLYSRSGYEASSERHWVKVLR